MSEAQSPQIEQQRHPEHEALTQRVTPARARFLMGTVNEQYISKEQQLSSLQDKQTLATKSENDLSAKALENLSVESRKKHWEQKVDSEGPITIGQQVEQWNHHVATWIEDSNTSEKADVRNQALSSLGIDTTNHDSFQPQQKKLAYGVNENGTRTKRTEEITVIPAVETLRERYFTDKSNISQFVADIAANCRTSDTKDAPVDMNALADRLSIITPLLASFGTDYAVDKLVDDYTMAYGLLTQKEEDKIAIAEQAARAVSQELDKERKEGFEHLQQKSTSVKQEHSTIPPQPEPITATPTEEPIRHPTADHQPPHTPIEQPVVQQSSTDNPSTEEEQSTAPDNVIERKDSKTGDTENGSERVFAEEGAAWSEAGAAWVVGGRAPDVREDRHVIEKSFGGSSDQGFFAVYDGHGGKKLNSEEQEKFRQLREKYKLEQNGIEKALYELTNGDDGGKDVAELAAQELHKIVGREIHNGKSPQEALTIAYHEINQKADEFGVDYAEVGTTAITALFAGDKLYIAHVGDSRAVLAKGNRVSWISQDHPYGNRNSRDLGNNQNFPNATPDVEEFSLNDGYTRLILASDGLWDVVTNEQALELIKDEPDTQKAAQILQQAALQSGDNITIVVVNLQE